MELYRIGPRLEEVQRPLAPEDRALVLLTSQELERPPQQAGPEDVLRHTPSAREARGCRAEVRRDCLCGTVVTPPAHPGGRPHRLRLSADGGPAGAVRRQRGGLRPGPAAGPGGRWQESGPGRLLCQLLELLLARDARHLEELEDQLGQLEDQVLSGRLDRFTAPVAALRRELMHWFRYYSQLGDVVYTLEEDDRGLFTPEEGRLLHLLSRRLGRLRDDAQLLREYCLQVRELFQTEVEIRQNRIMKALTLVTTLCLPLSLVAGWYGMNFTGMPELGWKYGYPAVIAVSVLIVSLCLWIMKKKKILVNKTPRPGCSRARGLFSYQAATAPSHRGSVPPAYSPPSVFQMICPRPMSMGSSMTSTWWPMSASRWGTGAGTSRSSWMCLPPIHWSRGASRAAWGAHVVVHRIHHHLHVTLGLHKGPHHPEGAHRLPVLHEEAGDDGVVGALAPGQAVVAVLVQEKLAPRFCREMPVPGMATPAPKVV